MRTVNLLAATATIISFTSAFAQVISYLGNACAGEELFSESLSSEICVSVADIEPSSSMTISGLARGRVNFYYNDHCTDEVDHTTFDECYLEGSRQTFSCTRNKIGQPIEGDIFPESEEMVSKVQAFTSVTTNHDTRGATLNLNLLSRVFADGCDLVNDGFLRRLNHQSCLHT